MIDLELERNLRKYSTALLDLAKSKNSLEVVNADMKIILELFSTVYLSKKNTDDYNNFSKKFLVISNARQSEIIKQILKDLNISKLVFNFIMLLLVSKKINILRRLVTTWDSLFLTYKGYFKVQVSSVVTMSEEQLGKIKDTIAKKYGNNFFVETKLDPSILGGLVIFVKNQVIDDSLASKIKKIEKNVRGTT
jgi:F-type H+-transporting ATPase subunit delta